MLKERDIVVLWKKARELAEMDKYEFGLLSRRGVERHYGLEECDDDLSYARSE